MNELELYHFGIKGMKWGIRRYQNKDGSLTPAGRERIKTLASDGVEKISEKDNLKIAKGTTMYRVSTKQQDSADTQYMSYRNNDRNFYKGYWGHVLQETHPNAKLYEQTYTAVKDILIPSAKTRRKILSDMLEDESIIKSLYGDKYSDKSSTEFRSASKRWSESDRAKYLSKFMGTNPDILAKYGEQIILRGFNAVIDDGGRTVGEMPVILFTANSSTINRGSEMISQIVQDLSKRTYSANNAANYRRKTASI